MKFVLDAFNLIYKFEELEEYMYRGQLDKARQGLLKILGEFNKTLRKPRYYILFIDGKKNSGNELRGEKLQHLEVHYSHDLSADFMIRTFIEQSAIPRDLHIVSSDKAVISHARSHRCYTQTSEEFAAEVRSALGPGPAVASEQNKPETSSAAEIAYWEDQFKKR